MAGVGEDAECYGCLQAARVFERCGVEGAPRSGIAHVEVHLREDELTRLLMAAYLHGFNAARRLMGP